MFCAYSDTPAILNYTFHSFSTTEDNQSIFRVKLYEGERSLKKDRKYLGEVALGGILAAPRGIPKIEVTLQVDDDGYHIQIKDRGTLVLFIRSLRHI